MFYELYHHEAEEYDREFTKRYDEDLNTTLIFVCIHVPHVYDILTWLTGWSILCCDICIHHPGPTPAPVRP